MSQSPQSIILSAIENGINIDLLLQSVQIDKETFLAKVYSNQLLLDEWRILKAVIKDWEEFQ